LLAAVGSLASGRVLVGASLLTTLVIVVLVEGYYDISFVRVGSMATGVGVEGAYVVGVAAAFVALVGNVVLYGSRETSLAFRFYSGGFGRCILLVMLGSVFFALGSFFVLSVVLASATGDPRASSLLVMAAFADYIVISLLFYGLSVGFSEARLLAAIIVFLRVVTPPLEEAWFTSPGLVAYFYINGRFGPEILAAYLLLYGSLGALACRVLAWRG